MIGRLSGVLVYRGRDHILLDVRGVGYVVQCSERTLAGMPAPGEAVSLFTELLVREDLLQLYGFPSLLEKEWHRLLTSVQGVGAKAAMSILSALGAEGVGRAIALGDWGALRKAQGVGPKIAQRVVNELKDKGPEIMALGGALEVVIEDGMAAEGGIEPPSTARPAAPSAASDQAGALSALVNLGYGQGEAAGAVATAAGAGAEGEAALIRAALRLLAPKG